MISIDMYINNFKESTYQELLKERERLLTLIHSFEEKLDDLSSCIIMDPFPEAMYIMNLSYLIEITKLLKNNFNKL